MDMKFPSWAYGKFKIVPDPDLENVWNVKEKGWLFFSTWEEHYKCEEYRAIPFLSVDDAKFAIEKAIMAIEKSKSEKEKLKQWRKTRSIWHP